MSKHLLQDIITTNINSTMQSKSDTFPSKIAKDRMDMININSDFSLFRTDYKIKQKFSMVSNRKDKKFVITATIDGKMAFKSDEQTIPFTRGFTTITHFENIEGKREFDKTNLKQIRVVLSENFLQRNLREEVFEKYMQNKQSLQIVSFAPTSLASQFILKELLNTDFSSELGFIYASSKALELLHVELNRLNKEKLDIILDNYDTDAIYHAKEILLKNMKNPPSIIELSKLVHINEFKLKKGFKQIFGTTPFNLLYEKRMIQAKELLISGEYSVNEVASKVGYKFANNFSNAFMRKFGANPKEFKRV